MSTPTIPKLEEKPFLWNVSTGRLWVRVPGSAPSVSVGVAAISDENRKVLIDSLGRIITGAF